MASKRRSTGEVHALLSDVGGQRLLEEHGVEIRTHSRGPIRGNAPISIHLPTEQKLLGQLTLQKGGALEVRHSAAQRDTLTRFGDEVGRRLRIPVVHTP